MDVSSINSDLIRGNVTTIILKALAEEDRYGYDILREIEVKSGGQYKLKQPTLYSCLKRLEKQGLISSYWGEENDTEGGRRRYYSLTEAGKGYLLKMQSEYEYSRTILDSLLSEEKFDFERKDAPFDINSLRPYTKRSGSDDEEVQQASADAEKPAVPAPSIMRDEIAVDEVVKPAPTPAEDKPNPVKQPLFEPLDKGAGSYDEGYRHTSRSVFDIVGEINSILGKEPAKTEQEQAEKAEIVESTPSPEIVVPEKPIEQAPIAPAPERRESILAPRPAPEPVKPVDDEAERLRREEAKRALGIGYGEKKNPVEVFDEAQKKTEITDFPVEDKTVDVDREAERAATRELLFGNRDEKPVEADMSYLYDLPDGYALLDKYNKPSEPAPQPKKPVEEPKLEKSPVPPASTFSFRHDDTQVVNYRDAFSVLRGNSEEESEPDEEIEAEIKQKPASSIDLKTKMFSEGYKLRPYTRENTEGYYSLNYIKKNRINRDSYAILYLLICFEVLVGWLIFRDRFSDMAYAAVCIIALLVPALPFVVWSINPDKRVRANYNFRTSVLNRLMLYLNLLVIVCLVGFFGFNANINDGNSMIAPILIPALLLLNLPLSSLIYLILYNTKKYHIS